MQIRLSERIASGATFVVPVVLKRLDTLHKDSVGGHTLTTLGLTVRVNLRVGKHVGTPVDGAVIHVQAKGAAAAFPVFRGTLRVEPVDTFSSRLVLAGDYSVPLGALGSLADQTLLIGAAKRSLHALLSEMQREIAAAVLQSVTGG